MDLDNDPPGLYSIDRNIEGPSHQHQGLFEKGIQEQILRFVTYFTKVLMPAVIQIIRQRYVKQPYHTSILTGQGWVDELVHGHPLRIRTELGVSLEVFQALISKLREMGHGASKHVTLEEQVAIFLYACVTGLSVRHLGERFQRSNETISKYILIYFHHG
jgi:hypothetical protein